MSTNRSMPPGVITPELPYPDVQEAVQWLCGAFGFAERLRIGNHRAQLTFGNGAVVVTEQGNKDASFSVMVSVANVDSHHEKAKQFGARIISPPADYPYGERQYTVEDIGGHHWTFSQSIADVDPATWGGVLFE